MTIKTILIILAVVVLIAIIKPHAQMKFPVRHCAYCGGTIFWHKVSTGFFSSRYVMEYEKIGQKSYHKWCYKLITKGGCQ